MAVSRTDKETQLQELEAAFQGTESAVLLDFRGLKVPQVTELRRQIRGVQARYRVVKNTLARRALQGTPYESLADQFRGTTAVAYSGEDPVALAKVITTFAKTAPALAIKAALVQGRAVAAAEVGELATLPGRAELYARLLGVMQAPMVQFVRVLNAAPQNLLNVLVQVEKQRND